MYVACQRRAPRAGLAEQQQRRLVLRHLRQLIAKLLHDAALADRHEQGRDERSRDCTRLAPGDQRTLDDAQQLGERERLFDEVVGAQARGFDRGLDRAVAGHHHDRAWQRPL